MKLASSVLVAAMVTVGTTVRAQSSDSFDPPIDSALAQIVVQVQSHAVLPADSVASAKEGGLAGVGFVGALAWYPGALAGVLAGAGEGNGTELRRQHRLMTAVVAGGGASTGLVVGLLVASKRRCDPVRTIGRAVLGGEIGSFAGAAATGAFGLLSSGGIALAAAPVVVPLASALVAIAMVRGCNTSR